LIDNKRLNNGQRDRAHLRQGVGTALLTMVRLVPRQAVVNLL
jgi:hypothetical protein